VLASLDQPAVREKAVACLAEFTKGQRATFFNEHFYPLVKKLASSEFTPAKLSGVALMHVVYPRIDEDKKPALRELFLKLGEDEIPLVRRTVAEYLVRISEVFPKAWIKDNLIDLWRKLAMDQFDMVRIKAFESVSDLSIFLSKEENESRVFSLLKGLALPSVSWQVRYSLCETLILIMDKITPATVKTDVAGIFEALLADSECEVKSIALLKIPELCKHLEDD
jgi:serine/threonine-protein phosphatase 2A regulatory subunit A